MIKPSVICLRERNNEFSCALVTSVHVQTCILQSLGIHKGDELKQKIWLCFEKIWCFFTDGSFELRGISSWDAVPGFRFSPVHYE